MSTTASPSAAMITPEDAAALFARKFSSPWINWRFDERNGREEARTNTSEDDSAPLLWRHTRADFAWAQPHLSRRQDDLVGLQHEVAESS